MDQLNARNELDDNKCFHLQTQIKQQQIKLGFSILYLILVMISEIFCIDFLRNFSILNIVPLISILLWISIVFIEFQEYRFYRKKKETNEPLFETLSALRTPYATKRYLIPLLVIVCLFLLHSLFQVMIFGLLLAQVDQTEAFRLCFFYGISRIPLQIVFTIVILSIDIIFSINLIIITHKVIQYIKFKKEFRESELAFDQYLTQAKSSQVQKQQSHLNYSSSLDFDRDTPRDSTEKKLQLGLQQSKLTNQNIIQKQKTFEEAASRKITNSEESD